MTCTKCGKPLDPDTDRDYRVCFWCVTPEQAAFRLLMLTHEVDHLLEPKA